VYNDNLIIITFVLLMETKTARLTILIDPVKKKAFDELCQAQDLTPSQVIRQMIREYLDRHDVGYATKNKIGTAPSRNDDKA
jgi:hypothetical protein